MTDRTITSETLNPTDAPYLLAIETAVSGGSLSILQNNKVITDWTGTSEISKVEEVLTQIGRLLNQQCIKKCDIRNIIVSRGPGSHTGARIGIATGLGLKKAWNCGLCGISIFDALSLLNSGDIPGIAAFPLGRRQIVWQQIGMKQAYQTQPEVGILDDFIKLLKRNNNLKLILHNDIVTVLNSTGFEFPKRGTEIFTNISVLLGWFANLTQHHANASDNVEVLYLNK